MFEGQWAQFGPPVCARERGRHDQQDRGRIFTNPSTRFPAMEAGKREANAYVFEREGTSFHPPETIRAGWKSTHLTQQAAR
ncbi:hypothetical protein DA792_21500 (plasmid) [Celeribacter baekdonensis]|uniref:Uncharacterized protein n=1 Tax=Celeribacter baekdonensis TaxID=875171 RepID=A0A2R4M8U4_9RHOB|nr:hypothetical protein DA792_00375 [Celeribacter baekdonensis]AVW93576.1 hypothetical protein DA792_21280 [Celeribacter baekdonensis]AVW93617.1 hypothetical protein DA792_21500 [Celeribacter baekdonensis]